MGYIVCSVRLVIPSCLLNINNDILENRKSLYAVGRNLYNMLGIGGSFEKIRKITKVPLPLQLNEFILKINAADSFAIILLSM
jgi:hypothetical protein